MFIVHACDVHTILFTKNWGLDSRAPGAWGPACHLRPEHPYKGQPGFDYASLKEGNHPSLGLHRCFQKSDEGVNERFRFT